MDAERQPTPNSFAADILRVAGDEPIEAIAVARERGYCWSFGTDTDHELGPAPVAWEEALPVLDYQYDAGYGSQDCHSFYAWTATRVLSIHEYDGSTWIITVPRNPADHDGNFA